MQAEIDNHMLELEAIRGFDELVQGDKEVVEKLNSEYMKTGNKVASFYKIRDFVLTEEFAMDSLEDFLTMAIRRSDDDVRLNVSNDTIDLLQKALCEKILRDHVPTSAIEDLEKAILILYSNYEKNASLTLEKIGSYIQDDRPKFSHVLKKGLDIIEIHEKDQFEGIIA